MSNLIYFLPKQHRTPENKMILKFIPRDFTEAANADMAEKSLEPNDFLLYLSFIILYGAYNYISDYHKQIIKDLIDNGVLDEIAVHSGSGLTNSCVTRDKRFLYNDREFELPGDYEPVLRIVDSNSDIFVEAQNSVGKVKIYQFMYYKSDKKYIWKKIDEHDLLVDF